jgi:hypothetical protein
MKYYIFILSILLSVSIVFAQSNVSTSTQIGNGNSATVDQAGSQHESIIYQDTWGTGHTAVVNQNSGAENFSDLLQDQRGAEAYVDQIGSSNTSGLKQSGPNTANIYQQGDGNVLGSYTDFTGKAFQKNGTSFSDDSNVLDLDQLGNTNTAGTWQEHHAEATIMQNGNRNEAILYQSGQATGDLNLATIKQNGDDNSSDIYQFGEGNSASALSGHANYVSNLNNVVMKQVCDANTASFSLLWGDGNEADINQLGSSNYTEYSVGYGDDNIATMKVTGDFNRTRFGITAPWGSQSSDNELSITKTGNYNYVSGSVVGDQNDITLVQEGNSNRIGTSWYTNDGVNITGDLNTVNVSQLSDGNSSINTVTGNNNTISVIQN